MLYALSAIMGIILAVSGVFVLTVIYGAHCSGMERLRRARELERAARPVERRSGTA